MSKIINPYRFRDPNNPGKTDLVFYYELEEDEGATAFDSHTGGHDGTNVGADIDQIGKVNQCYDFSNDYISVDSLDSVIDLDNFSISIWVNPDTFGTFTSAYWGRIIKKGAAFDLRTYSTQQTTNGQIQFQCGDSLGTSVGDLVVNQWQHIITTFNGTTAKIYIDTVEKASDTLTGSSSNTDDLIIGNFDAGVTPRYFDGGLDEIMIYNKILTSGQRGWLNNDGNGREYSELN